MDKPEEEKEWDYSKVQRRLNKVERARYEQICAAIRKRNDKIRQSDVNKVLPGLTKPDKWITETEVEFFRGNVDSLVVRRQGAARNPEQNAKGKGRVVNGS